MGGRSLAKRARMPDERLWVLWLVACGDEASESLREHIPRLYAYLGKECAWPPSEMDKMPLGELVNYANECSRMNERAIEG